MFELPEYAAQLRLDVRHLRIDNARLKRTTEQHRQKSKRLEEELKRIKEENRNLHKENGQLKKEIEKLTKTNNRYRVALFDHGNFKKDTKSGKAKGGQPGHRDTNREAREGEGSYSRQRRHAIACGNCGRPVNRTNATREKRLIDIVINPEVVRLIIETERQWCGKCNHEVQAKHPQSLPFTEYGLNLFMMVMLLRFGCRLSLANIGVVIKVGYGLPISKSPLKNLLSAAKGYLKDKYEELVKAVRAEQIMYNDETGWLVHGRSAWMWIMANEEITVYQAAESRGKGIFENMYGDSKAKSMHDGYTLYESVTGKDRTLYCWSHLLRYAYEETVKDQPDSEGIKLRDELVLIYHLKKLHPEWKPDELEKTLNDSFDRILVTPATTEAATNIIGRVKTQRQGLINALIYTPDGTNNLAERELRGMAIIRQISNGSDTFAGMETTAVLASIVRTLTRQSEESFWNNLQAEFQRRIQSKYSQYRHQSFIDDS